MTSLPESICTSYLSARVPKAHSAVCPSLRTSSGQDTDLFANQSVLITGPSPGSIGEATALAIARQAPALLILAGRSPTKLDVVATSCREAAAAVSSTPTKSQEFQILTPTTFASPLEMTAFK